MKEWIVYTAWHGPNQYLAAIKEEHAAWFWNRTTLGMDGVE